MRKVSVCTLTDLNPGFGGSWNKLWIFFVMPQKKSFDQKKFDNLGEKQYKPSLFTFVPSTYLNNPSQDFKNSFFRVPMNPYQAWKAKLESALFWVFIIVKNQCAKHPLEFEGRFVNLFGNFSPLCALS